jgi:hypothetical protein
MYILLQCMPLLFLASAVGMLLLHIATNTTTVGKLSALVSLSSCSRGPCRRLQQGRVRFSGNERTRGPQTATLVLKIELRAVQEGNAVNVTVSNK